MVDESEVTEDDWLENIQEVEAGRTLDMADLFYQTCHIGAFVDLFLLALKNL